MKQLVYCLALSFLTASCHTLKEEAEGHEYAMKSYKLTSQYKPSDSAEVTYYKLSYPEFKNPEINQFILDSIVLDSGKTSVEAMGKSFISEYENFVKESSRKISWFEERSDSVAIETASYIGLISKWSNYTGGAHGMYSTIFHNYDVKAKRSIPLQALIPAEKMPELTTLAEQVFRKQEGLSSGQSLKEEYFFENGQFSLTDNYIFTPQGLLFLYNVYEIKPYVGGQTELLLPYSSVMSLLNKKGKALAEEVMAIEKTTE